ncbi:MAG: TolC family protein [Pseudomonadota bacterium]
MNGKARGNHIWVAAVLGILLVAGPAVHCRAANAPATDTLVTLGEAVYSTLSANPGVQIEKEAVVVTDGVVQTARGQFDWLFFSAARYGTETLPVSESTQRAQSKAQADNNAIIDFMNTLPGANFPKNTGAIAEEIDERHTTISAGVMRQFMNGITVSPSAAVVDYENSYDHKDPASRSDVYVTMVIPMLRGLGEKATGADYLAAESSRRATVQISAHNISQQVYGTVSAFWNCLAAQQSYALAKDSFERADFLLTHVSRMVDAGLVEPAFMNQARANLYANRADLTKGELAFRQRRQELALTMGYGPDQMVVPPAPSGEFPIAPTGDAASAPAPEALIVRAKAKRQDYLAALTSIDTQTILFDKAQNNTKPRMDFSIQVGYAGIAENDDYSRYYRSFNNRLKGPNGYAGVTLELPIYNDAARGQLVSQRAVVRQSKLSAALLLNQIAADVMLAVNAENSARSEYALAVQSAKAYQKAVAFEKKKYDAGESSLNALIDIEDRFIKSRLTVIEAVRKYAVARTQLLFATGALLEENNGEFSFDPDRITKAFP